MTDFPIDDAVLGDGPDPGRPIEALANLREEPSPRLLANVLDVINTRQTSSQAMEIGWWGMTTFVLEMILNVFRALGTNDDDKEA